MGKLTGYLAIMGGLILLFYFTGLLQECNEDALCDSKTPNSMFLDILMKPQNMRQSSIGNYVIGILAGLAAVGSLVLSGLVYERLEYAAVASFVGFLFTTTWDFIYVFMVVRAANPVIAILLFGPYLLIFIPTILEFMRGRD